MEAQINTNGKTRIDTNEKTRIYTNEKTESIRIGETRIDANIRRIYTNKETNY